MRTIWNIISVLALSNLIAILVFVLWLWQTKRLNGDRIQEVRNLLGTTADEQAMAEAEKAKQDAEAEAKAEDAARLLNPPMTSSAQVAVLNQIQQQTAQALRRLEEEKRQLSAALDARERAIEDLRRRFEAEKAAYQNSVAAQQDAETDEQFQKAVKLIESLPPKQGKEKITNLVNDGKTEQAVAYLNAMSGRSAGKILKEFKTPVESQLATDLLERLRRLGSPAEVGEPTDAGSQPDRTATGSSPTGTRANASGAS